MKFFRNFYNWIGIKYAPEGTACYAIDQAMRSCGRAFFGKSVPRTVINDTKRNPRMMAFWISGGIGDHLIAIRFIRDFLAEYGELPFDIYAQKPGVANWLMTSADFPSFNKCYDEGYATYSSCLKKYAGVFRLFSFIDFKLAKNAASLFDQATHEKLHEVEAKIKTYNAKIRLLIQQHPKLDGYMAEVALRHGFNRMNLQQGQAGIAYGGDSLSIPRCESVLEKHGLTQPYVTIHNGYDTEFRMGHQMMSGISTKTYPHFNDVVRLLRQSRPDIRIVQIGVHTSTPIEGCDINLIDQTSLPECTEILRHSMLHIDGESGLVHMAACLGIKSCVIFGPTSADFFGYARNINIRPTFCGNCWWMTEDWLASCPRGFKEARCLSEQDPQIVADRILAEIAPNSQKTEVTA